MSCWIVALSSRWAMRALAVRGRRSTPRLCRILSAVVPARSRLLSKLQRDGHRFAWPVGTEPDDWPPWATSFPRDETAQSISRRATAAGSLGRPAPRCVCQLLWLAGLRTSLPSPGIAYGGGAENPGTSRLRVRPTNIRYRTWGHQWGAISVGTTVGRPAAGW